MQSVITMGLKYKLDKEAYDALSDELKGAYEEVGDKGEYRLKVEGYDDPAELRRARDREKQAAQAAKERIAELEAKLAQIEGDDNRKRGDIDALEKSWREQKEKAVAEKEEELKKRDRIIQRVFRTNVADAMAKEISTVPVAMARLIQDRLVVEIENGEPVTRVLDKSGKPSALTVDDLKKELVADPDLLGMIKGSKASGSGATANPGGGATKKLHEMSDSERREWFQRDPEGFRQAVAAQTHS